MAVTYSIDGPARTVVVDLSAEASAAQLGGALGRLLDDPGFRPGFSLLIDGRSAPHPDTRCVRRFVQLLEEHQARLSGARIALVAPDPASFGMARMAQILAERLPLRVVPFRELAGARDWARAAAEG